MSKYLEKDYERSSVCMCTCTYGGALGAKRAPIWVWCGLTDDWGLIRFCLLSHSLDVTAYYKLLWTDWLTAVGFWPAPFGAVQILSIITAPLRSFFFLSVSLIKPWYCIFTSRPSPNKELVVSYIWQEPMLPIMWRRLVPSFLWAVCICASLLEFVHVLIKMISVAVHMEFCPDVRVNPAFCSFLTELQL